MSEEDKQSEQKPKKKLVLHINTAKGNDLFGDGTAEKPFRSAKGYWAYRKKHKIDGEVDVSISGSFSSEELSSIFAKREPNRRERRAAATQKRKS